MLHKSLELTKAEQEVLHLLTDEFLTLKQIQLRRQCSYQAVYKIIKNLKEKGVIDNSFSLVEKSQCSNPIFDSKDIRLHGQEFNIHIIFQDNRYQRLLKKSNILFIGGNTIKLYRNSIEVHSGNCFMGKSAKEAELKSLNHWKHFFARLEHDLKITILKDRSRNIKLVNQHYARGDSEIAENSIENKNQIRVFAEEDGKLAFITDDSFGFREDETVHPLTAKPDREAIDKQINDWRLNNPPTITQLNKTQEITANQLSELTGIMANYGKHIKSHTEAIVSLSKAIPELIKIVKNLKKENDQLKQRRIGDYG